jgi:hypothetical protein
MVIDNDKNFNFLQQNNPLNNIISQKQDFPSSSLIAPDQNIFNSIQQQEPSSDRNEKKEQIALREFNSIHQNYEIEFDWNEFDCFQ